jgi:hypothetical protein
MLFWTAAASMSRWVKREWQLAIKRGKKVVPTLLDDTPLPRRLARLNAVTSLRGLFPAPVRRPEELIQALVEANDFEATGASSGDDDLDVSEWVGNSVGDTPDARRSAASAPSSPFRLSLIAGSLAVVGLVTWFLLAPVGQSERPPSSSPAASRVSDPRPTTPSASASVSEAISEAISSVMEPTMPRAAQAPSPVASVRPTKPAPAPAPMPEEPSQLDALLEGPAWFLPLAALILVLASGLVLRRFTKHGRARSVVRELYAA